MKSKITIFLSLFLPLFVIMQEDYLLTQNCSASRFNVSVYRLTDYPLKTKGLGVKPSGCIVYATPLTLPPIKKYSFILKSNMLYTIKKCTTRMAFHLTVTLKKGRPLLCITTTVVVAAH